MCPKVIADYRRSVCGGLYEKIAARLQATIEPFQHRLNRGRAECGLPSGRFSAVTHPARREHATCHGIIRTALDVRRDDRSIRDLRANVTTCSQIRSSGCEQRYSGLMFDDITGG